MKRKSLSTIIIFLIASMLLAGCQGSGNDSSDISDKLKDKVSAAGEQDNADEKPEQSKKKKTKKEKAKEPGEPPVLVMHKDSKYEWGDGSVPLIKHTFGYLLVDDEYAKDHKGLADSLKDAREEIISKHEAAWDDEIKSVNENSFGTYDDSWNTYVRRADDSVVSFVNECCTVDEYEGGYYTTYIAHSYYTDSGKEIKLTDIVDDEDAFYDLMADKMAEYIEYALKNKYADDVDFDKNKVRPDMLDYLKDGGITWTLDPQGITFWEDSYLSAPEAFSTTVLFADDKDGVIFNEEFANDVRDEWISQSPEANGSYFDIDDSGKLEFVQAYPLYEVRDFEDSTEFFINRYEVHIGSANEEIMLDMPGGTDFLDFFYVHRDGRTYLLESDYEYDTYSTYIFTVEGRGLEEAGFIAARFETTEPNGETYDPYYIPTDLSNIRMMLDPNATDGGTCTISINKNGRIENTGKGSAASVGQKTEENESTEETGWDDTSEDHTIPEYFIYVISPDGYANLRTGPGTEYDVICQIPTGDSMEVYRETATDKKGNKWMKVAYWHPEGTSQLDGSNEQGITEIGWIAESQVE